MNDSSMNTHRTSMPPNADKVLLQLTGLKKTYDQTEVLKDINLDIKHGEFLTLLGPSGCGKTTLLRLIAGFEQPNAGAIYLDGVQMAGLSADKRPVNTVFQQYALFPHMTVAQNVAYGLKLKKIPKDEIQTRVREMLAMVQLEHLANRKPQDLSGGQQQRVAIARAVINRPKLLLLDEPLSALDHKLRLQMQSELKRLQRELGITFVFVTHDQEEALSMSDRIAVMKDGRFQQIGTPIEIYETPANLFTAKFIGETNLFRAEVKGVYADQPDRDGQVSNGRIEVEVCESQAQDGPTTLRNLRRPDFANDVQVGDIVNLLLRPEDLRIYDPNDNAHAGLLGRVIESNYKGSTLDSIIELANGHIIKASEFFDEDDPSFDYKLNEAVKVSWVDGWEWVLPDDDSIDQSTANSSEHQGMSVQKDVS
ncbi:MULTISPECIES: spermidine/putrescine ABC transporter ATP-binding protein PotA [Psychrobacter]|jgi:spermidine/putrescine transport system ATP-binding protein|uniref:spermidine/putrescine ABC transporter ATP-binding protein PotA n=2 Tax=Moraxellaceae TaxID=468 RepID=UPI00042782A7|nr:MULTISPECIES: spermidine/putrescine ABC transporter ATP-binding protein PotA [Psychrobacter]PKG36635.1 spermidine/putrescine ABC transporter ATP-binding protein PotA [Psychrobacter sp. Sarcosine-3u-12]